MPRTVWAAAAGRSRRRLWRAGNRYEGASKSSAAILVPGLAGRANRKLAQKHGGHRFRRATLSQSGTRVIVIPYSFARKLRPLRRAAWLLPRLTWGPQGPNRRWRPGRPVMPWRPFLRRSSRAKPGPRPGRRPHPSRRVHAEIAREIMGGVCTEKLQGHQRTGTVREHVSRSANMLDNSLQVRAAWGGEVVASVCASPLSASSRGGRRQGRDVAGSARRAIP